MKRFSLFFLFTAFFVAELAASESLESFLGELPVSDIRMLEKESVFEQIMEVMIEQPLDHNDPGGPTFKQRIYISHISPDKPVVLVTAGYDAKYYFNSEIALEFGFNQIIVEHRYFGKSVPGNPDWDYLNTWQAASDHHNIVETFKRYYSGKWISTGISKGGQTVMFHSYYYPGDVDIKVPYVAPLNYSIEDERIYAFLDEVGKRKERQKVYRFQKMMLKDQEKYFPVFRELSDKLGYTYDYAGGPEKAYEYCVLEYSFAFWQWGYVSASSIPGRKADPVEAVEHMNKIAGFDYFSDKSIENLQPFFYQALTEMGYYGYDLDEFKDYIRHVDNPVFTFTLPDDIEIEFNNQLLKDLRDYLTNEAGHFVYIYGENDTWSATGFFDPSPGVDSKVFVKEGGSHRTRINNMPDDQKAEVYKTIMAYLNN